MNGRPVRNSKLATDGVAYELRASCLVVQRIVLDQMRVTMTPGPGINFVSQGQSLSDGWTGDVKVDIPQTGISLARTIPESFALAIRWPASCVVLPATGFIFMVNVCSSVKR